MAWFDGTIDIDKEILEKYYLAVITEDFRLSEDYKHLAIINRFDKGSPEYNLSDPHREDSPSDLVSKEFYHIFYGTDALKVKEALMRFTDPDNVIDECGISLLRENEDGSLFRYSYGEIAGDAFIRQSELAAVVNDFVQSKDIFVLPLKIHLFACPVCGEKTLFNRGMWEVCEECCWEDDGFCLDDDDSGFGANGPFTIGGYREWYQKAKSLYPKESGFEIGWRIRSALPEDHPDEILKGSIRLWQDEDSKNT